MGIIVSSRVPKHLWAETANKEESNRGAISRHQSSALSDIALKETTHGRADTTSSVANSTALGISGGGGGTSPTMEDNQHPCPSNPVLGAIDLPTFIPRLRLALVEEYASRSLTNA